MIKYILIKLTTALFIPRKVLFTTRNIRRMSKINLFIKKKTSFNIAIQHILSLNMSLPTSFIYTA